jgi:RNA polymerase sigma-70 factor (ECF subfamily)
MNSSEVMIWSQTQERLKSFVLRYIRDRAVAEDIVQDVFLKVHDKLPQLRERDKISGWIFRIARNMITDHFRRESNTNRPIDLDWDDGDDRLNDCVSFFLREMLKTLPDKYRQALEFAEIEQMSQLQLAEKLNMSYSGAKTRVQRARQMLKEKMQKAYHIRFDVYGNALSCGSRLPCGCN